jgi:negative regulator of replication initiation
MNAPHPNDEFDAARIVVDVLRSLQPDEQARAIRWAQEKLEVIASSSPSVTDGGVGLVGTTTGSTSVGHELTAALNDPEFLRLRSAVDKMLHLLGVAYRLRRETFERVVLPIRGRRRRYFAKSEAEVANSGNSTQPRNIPGTEIWVMTNSPTPQKRDMLEEALRLLGFSGDAIRDAVAAIE